MTTGAVQAAISVRRSQAYHPWISQSGIGCPPIRFYGTRAVAGGGVGLAAGPERGAEDGMVFGRSAAAAIAPSAAQYTIQIGHVYMIVRRWAAGVMGHGPLQRSHPQAETR